MNVTKDRVIPLFFHYAIPSILGMLAISSASVVDAIFVGNFVGSTASKKLITISKLPFLI